MTQHGCGVEHVQALHTEGAFSTSGASDEPPMPSRTNVSNCI